MRFSLKSEAFASFQIRNYRLYWAGNSLSKLGTEMQTVALAWQVYLLTNEPLSLGLIGLVRAVPAIIFSVVGGALADSVDRRRLLIWLQLALMLISGVLAAVTLSGAATPWMFYALTFLAAIASSIDGPTQAALVPTLVPRQLMTNAITLNNLAWSMAGIIGPALGGLAIGWFGAGAAFGFNAVSFLAVAIALLLVDAPANRPVLSEAERSINGNLSRIKDGFAFVLKHRVIGGLMLLDFFAVLSGASLTLLPVFAKDILKVGPEGLGLLAAGPAAGSIVGALLLTFTKRPSRPGQIVLGSIVVYGLCTVLFGISREFWFSWLMLAGTGIADTVSMTMRQSIRQMLAPEEMRGRISGVSFLFAVSGTQLGEFEAGVAAQLIGTQPAVALGGMACVGLVLAVAALNSSIRRFEYEKENLPKGAQT